MRWTLAFVGLGMAALASACSQPAPQAPAAPATQATPAQTPAERGKYLVTVGGCDDCHSPKQFKPTGEVVPDMTRRLSGHPAMEKLPPAPAGLLAPDKFGAIVNNNFTAFVGPWGTSHARNLTPDKATGLGSWTEDMFIKTIRQGKHQGEGRALLPPMPWPNYAQMTDEDLKAVWAFLQTLPAINNAVPDPVPPPGAPPAGAPAK